MAKQLINLGTPNGGNGDTVRVAFSKINDNFSELYTGVDLNNVDTNINPLVGGTYDIGSVDRPWHAVWVGPEGVHIGDKLLSVNGQGAVTVDGVVIATPTGAGVQSDWSATSGPSRILNKPTLSPVATSNDYRDLDHKPTVPTQVSQLQNDAGYTTFSGSWNDLTNKPTLFNGSYLSLSNKPSLFSGAYSDLTGKPSLFSGSYLDLTNKPAIPTDVNQLTDVDSLIGGGIASTNKLVNGSNEVILGTDGNLTLPVGGDILDSEGNSVLGGTGVFTASTTAPELTPGALWFNTEEGKLYVNYNDTWVDANPTEIDPSAIRFNNLNQIELPEGGDIVNVNGVSVLNGNANTGNIEFRNDSINDVNGIFITNASQATVPTASITIPANGAGAVSITSNNNTWSFDDNGALIFPDALTIDASVIGKSSSNTITEELPGMTISETTEIESQIEIATTGIVIAKRTRITSNDGVTTSIDEAGSTLTVNNSTASIKHYVEPEGPNNGSYMQVSTSSNGAVLEGVNETLNGTDYGRVVATQNAVTVNTSVDGVAKYWLFDYLGGLTLPTPTSQVFTLTFDSTHYTPTIGKPSLELTSEPWQLEGQVIYEHNGDAVLQLNNIWPILINPGYTSGDTFTFSSLVHGLSDYTLSIVLNNVVFTGGVHWTANVGASALPAYPSSILANGAIKLTAGEESFILGSDGNLHFPDGSFQGTAFVGNATALVNGSHTATINEYGFLSLSQGTIETPSGLAILSNALDAPDYPVQWLFYNIQDDIVNTSYRKGVIELPGLQQIESSIGVMRLTNPGKSSITMANDVVIRAKAQLDSVYKTWGFGTNGEMNFPDGSSYAASTLTGAVDSDLEFEVKHITTVSAEAFHGGINDLIFDISVNDDITVVGPGWELNVGSELAPIWATVSQASINQSGDYEIIFSENYDFEDFTTYTFRNPVPVAQSWTIRSQTGGLVGPGGAIVTNETYPLVNSETYSGMEGVDYTSGGLMYFDFSTPTLYIDSSRFNNSALLLAIITAPVGTVFDIGLNSIPGGYTFTTDSLHSAGGFTGTTTVPSGQGAPAITNIAFSFSSDGGTYRELAVELPTADGLNEQRWTFSNDGKLTTPSGLEIFNNGAPTNNNEIHSTNGLWLTNTGLDYLRMAWALGDNTPSTTPGSNARSTSLSASNSGVSFEVIDADYNSRAWIFGPNGSLTFPSGAGFVQGDSGQLKTNDSTTSSLDFRDGSGRGFYTNSDGFSLRGDGDSTWKFGTDGVLNLPNDGVLKVGSLSQTSLGKLAGTTNQGAVATAIGFCTAEENQGEYATAIGISAGRYSQGANAVAVGSGAGGITQSSNAVAIGNFAGSDTQGSNAIAIGKRAGFNNQHANSIILNASGFDVNSDGTNRFYVKPIRNDTTSTNILSYNPTTYEITYGDVFKGGGSWTVTTGTNTYSFTVNAGATYVMWVRGTTDNGVISWNATVTITNTNLPAIGTQQAYAYSGAGTLLDFTSLPSQIVGTPGTVTRSPAILGTSSGLFEFGISNTSPGDATVYWGWTKI